MESEINAFGTLPYKEYALYIPPHEKRKPGRQGTLFLTYIQHLLGDTDDMIGQDKLSELAQDRCGWKKIVVVTALQPTDDDDFYFRNSPTLISSIMPI